MTTEAHRRPLRAPYIVRVIRARPRLSVSVVVGLVVLAVELTLAREQTIDRELATRLLVAWDVAVALYLGLVLHLMAGAEAAHIRQRAAIEDEGQVGILILTVAAALASLGAIVALLGAANGERQPSQLILATLTVLLSWAFIHTIFAIHYAHEFYSENGGQGGGLTFPGDDEPDYWDFVYFSFVIGMTSQVSDVAVCCKPIRRTATAHGIIAFVFNVALLALTVNIAASALQVAQPSGAGP